MKSILTLEISLVFLLPLFFSCKNADDVLKEYNAYFDIIPQTHEAAPGDPDFDARSMLLSTYDVRTDSSLSIPAPKADTYHWTFCSLAKDGTETTLLERQDKNLILDASTLALKVDTYTLTLDITAGGTDYSAKCFVVVYDPKKTPGGFEW